MRKCACVSSGEWRRGNQLDGYALLIDLPTPQFHASLNGKHQKQTKLRLGSTGTPIADKSARTWVGQSGIRIRLRVAIHDFCGTSSHLGRPCRPCFVNCNLNSDLTCSPSGTRHFCTTWFSRLKTTNVDLRDRDRIWLQAGKYSRPGLT